MDTSQKRFIQFAVGLIVLALIVFGLVYWYRSQGPAPVAQAPEQGAVVPQEPEATPMRITAKHQFKNGLHIVAGEVDVPTPCHTLTTNAITPAGSQSQVVINFNSITQGGICAQVITPMRFRVDFDAPENAQISATWNGKPAILNIIPVGANEDLTNFEIFFKG